MQQGYIGHNIRRARVDAGRTQKEQAIRLGLPLRSYQRFEQGQQDISAELLARIATEQRKPIEWYFVPRPKDKRRIR